MSLESILKKSSYDLKVKPVFRRFHNRVSPVMVDFGFIKSVAFKVEPHFHIGRHKLLIATFWASPITKRSAKN
jgi:hypothetical protein